MRKTWALLAMLVVLAVGSLAGGTSATGANHQVICGNCDLSQAPPYHCGPSENYPVRWGGAIWICYQGTWYYAG